MNYDSAGCYGCPIKDLTPNLDRLAAEGIRFHYAYSTVAVCQPVREIMHSGLYPHRNGAMGFFPLKTRSPHAEPATARRRLSDLDDRQEPALPARRAFCVDYAQRASAFASPVRGGHQRVPEAGPPARQAVLPSRQLHRPASAVHRRRGPDDLADGDAPSRYCEPEEVQVPGFLEDLPEVRREVAKYYTNVRRLDDCVGAVLQALKDEGAVENTLVMFYGGDHGMSFPFAKSNDYENSSRGALFLRWPGVIKPGGVDRNTWSRRSTSLPRCWMPLDCRRCRHRRPFLSSGDERRENARLGSGLHFLQCQLRKSWIPMRCVRTKDRSYIWNAWSDGKTQYQAENMNGLTWKAMLAAAGSDPAIKARTDFYLHRVPEEFYDLTSDRCERHNLIPDPSRQAEIESLRQELLALMQRTGDPLAEAFARRDKPEILAAARQKLMDEYQRPPRAKTKAKAKRAAAKGASSASQAPAGKDLIAFILPQSSWRPNRSR